MPDHDKTYEIYCPTTGAVVRKKMKDFDRHEVKANIFIGQGVVNVLDAKAAIAKKQRPTLPATARSHRFENGYLVLFVPSLRRDVRYPLTDKFVRSIAGADRKQAV